MFGSIEDNELDELVIADELLTELALLDKLLQLRAFKLLITPGTDTVTGDLQLSILITITPPPPLFDEVVNTSDELVVDRDEADIADIFDELLDALDDPPPDDAVEDVLAELEEPPVVEVLLDDPPLPPPPFPDEVADIAEVVLIELPPELLLKQAPAEVEPAGDEVLAGQGVGVVDPVGQ